MARHDKYYNQQGNAVSINGVPLVDFSDGDSIRTNFGGDQSSLTKGTDGATQNLINDRSGTIEVDLKATSVSNDLLAGLLLLQQAGNFLDLTGTYIEGTGAIHNGSGGAIKTPANITGGGPAMGKRTWVFEFTNILTDK